MKKYKLFLFHLIFLYFFCISGIAQRLPSKPNIILIVMDDMGYGDVTDYGGIDYETPNLNKLSSDGMRFTNFYAAQPICSASRAAIMTGCYPNRVGITGVLFPGSKVGISSEEETIGSVLKGVGYRTCIIGKWHLGDAFEFLPLQHGFDEYFGLPYSNDMWPYSDLGVKAQEGTFKYKMPPLPLIEDNEPIRYINSLNDQNMLTTWYTERAIDFIKRSSEHPFFLYFAESMVHIPLGVSDKFKGKSKQGLFGDVMMEIDWSVGEIMKTLKNCGLDEKTLVVFTSDNGPWLIYGDHAGSSGGLREGKMATFDGGQKEPAIFRWPGVIKRGTINNKLASTIDLLPTFASLTKAPLPNKRIDGVDITSLLLGVEDADPRDHLFFYYNKNDLEAVRKGHWKLVFPHKYLSVMEDLPGANGLGGNSHIDSVGLSLYDLRRDPGERYNILEQHPKIVKELEDLASEARKDLGDDLKKIRGKGKREPGRILN